MRVTKKLLRDRAKAAGKKRFVWNGDWYYTSNGKNVERMAAYYQKNREQILEQGAAHYVAHREERRVYAAKLRSTPEAKANKKAYDTTRNATPEAKAHQKACDAKARAKAREILGNTCVWTGSTTRLHIDHIIPVVNRESTGFFSYGTALARWVIKHPVEARQRLQLLTAAANRFKGTRNNDEAKADWMARHPQLSLKEAA